MITNREEVIDKAFKGVSEDELRKGEYQHAGESLWSGKDRGWCIIFPTNSTCSWRWQTNYAIQMQTPSNKFAEPAETLAEFIDQYVAGVRTAMNRIVKLVECSVDNNDCCPNFYYFHFLSQVRMYYPESVKNGEYLQKEHELWRKVIQKPRITVK